MTFRLAALIHKHATQQQRRTIIPGISLAAATLVAVVLLMVTTTTTQAHDPGVEPDETSLCAGIGSGKLSVGALNSVSRVTNSPNSDCQLSVEVAPPSTQGLEPTQCKVSYAPVSTSDGLEVAFTMTGECDGVRVDSEISIPNDNVASGVALASASSKWALSKLAGHDVAHVPMFLHYARVDWTYTNSVILSARDSGYSHTNDWWHIHSLVRDSQMNSNNTIFDAWHDVEWHSDGFPSEVNRDVYANSRVTTRARAGGSHTCYYTFTWVSGAGWYPKLHKHTYCQHN